MTPLNPMAGRAAMSRQKDESGGGSQQQTGLKINISIVF